MCVDYSENEAEKRYKRERQARIDADNAARAQAQAQSQSTSTATKVLPRTPGLWGSDATARIYEVVGIKGDRIPANLSGDFVVDGFNIRVKKANGGGARVFLKVSSKRFVPVAHVRHAKFTGKELTAFAA
jgi:hypothetical protein